MRRFLAVTLSVICILSLAACGQKESDAVEKRNYYAGYDNPETCYVSSFNYLRVPDDNHLNRNNHHSIVFREDGSASIFLCDVLLYDTMEGIYQYGEGEIFNIVTGDTIRVKSEEEIVFTKNGTDYTGVREDGKWYLMHTPPVDDKYICTKNEITYAYQFREDETVAYYENDVLIETLPCYYGEHAVGLRGKVYCFSSDEKILFIGDDLYTLGGVECELPENALDYTAAGLFDGQNAEGALPDGMNEFGFYYDREYKWVYVEDGSRTYEEFSLIFKENGMIQIKGENKSLDDVLAEDLEYSYQKVMGKNFHQGSEFSFSIDGKIVVYEYKDNPYIIFSMVE